MTLDEWAAAPAGRAVLVLWSAEAKSDGTKEATDSRSNAWSGRVPSGGMGGGQPRDLWGERLKTATEPCRSRTAPGATPGSGSQVRAGGVAARHRPVCGT